MKSLVIAGDLTDRKDYHDSALVNRIVRSLVSLAKAAGQVTILMGNHDFLRDGHAFFDFLNVVPGIRFITRPADDSEAAGPLTMFLPYTKNPRADWQGMDFSHYAYLFMHQTAPGSVASNGQKMDGEELPSLKGPKVYSGDIHVPQVCGDIEYIGSPYHVHFGDRFEPRVILIDSRERPVDLFYPTISRLTLTVNSLRELKSTTGMHPKDQVKLRVRLAAADKHDWHRIRREATAWLREQQVEVHDVELLVQASTRRLIGQAAPSPVPKPATTTDAVLDYVLAEELGPDALEMGYDLVQS